MKRIQRRRTKGWRMPAGAVYVGRGSKWGNPYCINNIPYLGVARFHVFDKCDLNIEIFPTKDRAVKFVCESYRIDLEGGELKITVADVKRELKGKDLACWCAEDQPCHADVLLELANK